MKHQITAINQKTPDLLRQSLERDVKRRRRFSGVALITVFPLLIWILWETYNAGNLGFGGKTLWDWMELLIIPTFLAFAVFLLNKSQKETELLLAEIRHYEDQEVAQKKAALDRELAKDKQQQETLEVYFDRMTSLLLDKNLRTSQEGDEVRSIARTLTLTALRGLDETRKSLVVQFLYESGLINRQSILDMSLADLRKINLKYAKLDWISLPKANLRGANLQSASLIGANFYFADLDEADFSWANLTNANLRAGLSGADLAAARLDGSTLDGANLQGAKLINASLIGASLRHANLKFVDDLGGPSPGNLRKADLFLSDLTGADLYGAKVDLDQLVSTRSLKGAIMPNGRSFEEWKEELNFPDDSAQVASD
jgi:uncharacterized protein YjbI with pentapeptide repeats